MFKKIMIISLLVTARLYAAAQPADSVYNKYLDFNLARLQGEEEKLKTLGESLIPVAEKLPEKARINFYFSIGKIYEDANQHNKAQVYYEKVAAAVPDYYVVHRALGYIYLEKVKSLEKELNAAKTNPTLYQKLKVQYTAAVKKTLPELEKAQACDPSDETLAIIKILYKNIGDTPGLGSLDSRLKQMGQHCIDILTDK